MNGVDQANARAGTFQQDPGYGFQVSQALRGVDMGAASRGLLHSGATVAAEEGRASDLANQSFGQWYNRLAGIAQAGQTTAAQVGQQGVTTGQGIANTDQKQGNALASVYGNEASGIGATANKLFSNLSYQGQDGTGAGGYVTNALGGLFGGGSGGSSGSDWGGYGASRTGAETGF